MLSERIKIKISTQWKQKSVKDVVENYQHQSIINIVQIRMDSNHGAENANQNMGI